MHRMSKYGHQHFPCRSHCGLPDSMGIKLKRQFHIAVAEQGLHGLWIGSRADQERCQTVAKVVKSKPAGIIFHKSPAIVAMR
jgi:hypothetical protein